ncbi:MAG: UDP-N-acetylglucosamine 1-carboxyvinyltransferase [Lachnospiraceae bacterium]|nr:UDP-N-acetylglucosamine 1-carboxyvinyltransferase [Lachnospiraceae bacterium]
MKAISVKEASCLKGTIAIQGSKNTVLPIIAATILTSGISVIYNCPDIIDVHVMCELLNCLNIRTCYKEHTLTIDTNDAAYNSLPYELTGRLRSSVLMLGAMLARWGRAEIGMPGGCTIGTRPIDIHLEGFSKMNVDIEEYGDCLRCKTFYMQGCDFVLRYPSVGATENLLLAACGAKGRTVLRGAAKEPEIIELCNYLVSLGILIDGIGTDVLVIKGTGCIGCSDYVNVYDRIVAGTYLLMSCGIPADIRLTGIDEIHYIRNVLRVCAGLGLNVVRLEHYLHIQSSGIVCPGDFATGIYPEFPTDLLPMLITVLTKAMGESSVTETVFENRFAVVSELRRLGARVNVNGNRVYIDGNDKLTGHTVKATDLRQGAAMVTAGLMASGYTTITDTSFIQRGYEDIVGDLKGVGAVLEYI